MSTSSEGRRIRASSTGAAATGGGHHALRYSGRVVRAAGTHGVSTGGPAGWGGRGQVVRVPGTSALCDYFARVVTGGFGTAADANFGTWSPWGGTPLSQASVDGDDAVVLVAPYSGSGYPGEFYAEPVGIDRVPLTITCSFEFHMDPYPLTYTGSAFQFWIMTASVEPTSTYIDPLCGAEMRVWLGSGGVAMDLYIVDDRDGDGLSYLASGVIASPNDTRLMLRWVIDAQGMRARLWPVSGTEPETWDAEIVQATASLPGVFLATDANSSPKYSPAHTKTLRIGSICLS